MVFCCFQPLFSGLGGNIANNFAQQALGMRLQNLPALSSKVFNK